MKSIVLLLALAISTPAFAQVTTKTIEEPTTQVSDGTVAAYTKEAIASTKQVADTVTTTVVNTVQHADTAKLSHRLYDDVKSGLSQLAAGLKVGAVHVYEVLVKQQVVFAVMWTLMLLASIGLLLLSYKQWALHAITERRYIPNPNPVPTDSDSYRHRSEIENPHHDDNLAVRHFTITLISSIAGFTLFLAAAMHSDVILTGFINPEYGAIEKIMDMVKGNTTTQQ